MYIPDNEIPLVANASEEFVMYFNYKVTTLGSRPSSALSSGIVQLPRRSCTSAPSAQTHSHRTQIPLSRGAYLHDMVSYRHHQGRMVPTGNSSRQSWTLGNGRCPVGDRKMGCLGSKDPKVNKRYCAGVANGIFFYLVPQGACTSHRRCNRILCIV